MLEERVDTFVQEHATDIHALTDHFAVCILAVDELARRGEFTPPDQCLEGSRFTPELVAQALNKGGIPKFRDFKKDVSRVFQSNVKPKLIRGKDDTLVEIQMRMDLAFLTKIHAGIPENCHDIQLVFDSLRALFLRESATLQDTFDSALPELVMQEVLLLGWNCVVYTVEMLEKLTGGAVLDKPTVCVNNLAALYRFFDALEHPLLQQSLKAIDVHVLCSRLLKVIPDLKKRQAQAVGPSTSGPRPTGVGNQGRATLETTSDSPASSSSSSAMPGSSRPKVASRSKDADVIRDADDRGDPYVEVSPLEVRQTLTTPAKINSRIRVPKLEDVDSSPLTNDRPRLGAGGPSPSSHMLSRPVTRNGVLELSGDLPTGVVWRLTDEGDAIPGTPKFASRMRRDSIRASFPASLEEPLSFSPSHSSTFNIQTSPDLPRRPSSASGNSSTGSPVSGGATTSSPPSSQTQIQQPAAPTQQYLREPGVAWLQAQDAESAQRRGSFLSSRQSPLMVQPVPAEEEAGHQRPVSEVPLPLPLPRSSSPPPSSDSLAPGIPVEVGGENGASRGRPTAAHQRWASSFTPQSSFDLIVETSSSCADHQGEIHTTEDSRTHSRRATFDVDLQGSEPSVVAPPPPPPPTVLQPPCNAHSREKFDPSDQNLASLLDTLDRHLEQLTNGERHIQSEFSLRRQDLSKRFQQEKNRLNQEFATADSSSFGMFAEKQTQLATAHQQCLEDLQEEEFSCLTPLRKEAEIVASQKRKLESELQLPAFARSKFSKVADVEKFLKEAQQSAQVSTRRDTGVRATEASTSGARSADGASTTRPGRPRHQFTPLRVDPPSGHHHSHSQEPRGRTTEQRRPNLQSSSFVPPPKDRSQPPPSGHDRRGYAGGAGGSSSSSSSQSSGFSGTGGGVRPSSAGHRGRIPPVAAAGSGFHSNAEMFGRPSGRNKARRQREEETVRYRREMENLRRDKERTERNERESKRREMERLEMECANEKAAYIDEIMEFKPWLDRRTLEKMFFVELQRSFKVHPSERKINWESDSVRSELDFIRSQILTRKDNIRETKTDAELLNDARYLGKSGDFLRQRYESLGLRERLGVDRSASSSDIRKAYMKKVLLFHPDNIRRERIHLFAHMTAFEELCADLFRLVEEAYRKLVP